MFAVVIYVLVGLVLMGCATTTYDRAQDLSANLPRALGMGAFAPSCFLFCFVNARFERGGDETLPTDGPNAGDVESHDKTGIYLKRKKP